MTASDTKAPQVAAAQDPATETTDENAPPQAQNAQVAAKQAISDSNVIDQAEALGEKLTNALNMAALGSCLSIGHRLGLFDAIADKDSFTTSELADSTGCNERYIREWSSALACAQVLTYDPSTKSFTLPSAVRSLLECGKAQAMFTFFEFVSMFGTVEDDLMNCFKKGGGLGYDKYRTFHGIMQAFSRQTVVSALMDSILPSIGEGTVEKLEKGVHVLDCGCGRGTALNVMAEHFPNSTFKGYDLCPDTVAFAQKQAESQGLANVTFVQRDLSNFHETSDEEKGMYDLVFTFDAVHDQAFPKNMLKGIWNVLKDDGVYLAQDIKANTKLEDNFEHPSGPFLYA